MDSQETCPKCSVVFEPISLGGLCPRCLLKAAVVAAEMQNTDDSPTAPGSAPEAEAEHKNLDKKMLFERLWPRLAGEQATDRLVDIAQELGMNENAVKTALHRMRKQYQILLRKVVADTLSNTDDVEGELSDLLDSFQ